MLTQVSIIFIDYRDVSDIIVKVGMKTMSARLQSMTFRAGILFVSVAGSPSPFGILWLDNKTIFKIGPEQRISALKPAGRGGGGLRGS